MEANCWNYLLFTTVISFRIVYSRSNRAWGAGSQPCRGTSPCVYHLVFPLGALFFRFDAPHRLASARLPTNYLLTFWNPVCKLCTLRRGEPSLVLRCFFRSLLLDGHNGGDPFWFPNDVAPSKIHKVRLW